MTFRQVHPPQRWSRLDELFHSILELPADQRHSYARQLCRDDPELLRTIERMIDADLRTASLAPLSPSEDSMREAILAEQIQSDQNGRIGPYRLIRLVGAGGMGTVWLADRNDEQFKRHVAVKLIKRGMDTDEVLRRFRNERQVLAHLEHPNIARLYDGGAADDGRPYLVMEFVDGVPITRYCAERRLPLDERLRLFLKVCDAVQYAHQQLVIHRDLKPGNILVTADAEPKLLDFGIAKVLNPGPEDLSQTTTHRTRALTPQYASPEQLLGKKLTVATDVYSLGAILYELLTGRSPFHLDGQPRPFAERGLRQASPRRPSSIVARRQPPTDSGLNGLPLGRGAETDARRRRLRGDLDAIVLMALRNEPEARYASVARLADDIRRHLGGLPVTARRGTFRYRVGKFLRRHAAAVLVACGLVGVLVAATVVTARYAVREARQRAIAERRFEDVRQLAGALLFDIDESIRDLAGSTEAREKIVTIGLRYLDSLADHALAHPQLQRDIAAGYLQIAAIQGHPFRANLGRTHAALESWAKAWNLIEPMLNARSPHHPALRLAIRAYHCRGALHEAAGNSTAAVEDYLRGIAYSEKCGEPCPRLQL